MDGVAAIDRPAGGMTRLRVPVCVFVVAYGLAKFAELADWSRLQRDTARMLGVGSGTATGLLAAGKGFELLLTVLAAFALVRRGWAPLLAALAGWTADLAVLAVVAVSSDDRGRLLEHGLTFVVFGCLLIVTYAYSRVPAGEVAGSVPRSRAPESPTTKLSASGAPTIQLPTAQLPTTGRSAGPRAEPQVAEPPVAERTVAEPPVAEREEPEAMPADATARDAMPGGTRQDLPVRGAVPTRLDLPVRRPGATRQDLPVRRPAPKPKGDR